MKIYGPWVAALALAGCAQTNTIQTSGNTAIVQASAAPVCGQAGAARVAQRQAAITTIRAGFDRYIITSADAANNVTVSQLPGSYQTSGRIGGGGLFSATTTYRPGPTIVAGSHESAFGIRMFHDGEPGAENALSARATLGEDWAEKVKQGALTTCT